MNNAAAMIMLLRVCLLTQREYALNTVIFVDLSSRNSVHCSFNWHLFLLIFFVSLSSSDYWFNLWAISPASTHSLSSKVSG